MRSCGVGLARERLPKACDRLVELPQLVLRSAEIVIGIGIIGLRMNSPTVARNGFLETGSAT